MLSMGFILGKTVYPSSENYPLDVEEKHEFSDIVKTRREWFEEGYNPIIIT